MSNLSQGPRRGPGALSRTVLLGLFLLGLTSMAQAQLSGSYTIDPTGTGSNNYTSFAAAVTALTTSGVSGPVTFTVASGTYNETITIPTISGASATNTITFDGGTGNAATRIVQNSLTTYGAVITLNGADYLTFKNLTFKSTGTSYGTAMWFYNAANYNTVDNCVLMVDTSATSSTIAALVSSGSTTSFTTTGNNANWNTISNNQIVGGYYGITWYGYSSSDTTNQKGNKFLGNTIRAFYYYGARVYYGNAQWFHNNKMHERWSWSTGQPVNISSYGLYWYYQNAGTQVIGNVLRGGYMSAYTYYMNYYTSASPVRAKFINNMCIATATTNSNYNGYFYYGYNVDVWHNSFRAYSTSYVYGPYFYGSTTGVFDVRNNIITAVASSVTGTQYLMYHTTATNFFSAFDYNVFYSPNPNAKYYYMGTEYTGWANLPRTTHNINSMFGDPNFAGPHDLHSYSGVTYNTGTPLGVATDLDGDTRSTTTPCIGADEYTATAMAYASSTSEQTNSALVPAGTTNNDILALKVVTTGLSSPVSVTSITFNTTGCTAPGTDITNAKVYYTGTNSTFATGTQFGSTYAGPNGTFTITGTQNLVGGSTNYFWLTYDVSASATVGNTLDAEVTSVTVASTAYAPTVTSPTGSRTITEPMNGTYTINPTGSGSRNFLSFTEAVSNLSQRGVSAAVTINVAAATYTESITLTPIIGASATNTVTFDGGAGNAATRILQYNCPGNYDKVVLLNGVDYVAFKNLTIKSSSASGYGTAVWFTNQANYNTIDNCVLYVDTTMTNTASPLVASSSLTGYSTGNNAHWNTISNNQILGGYYGCYWMGSGSTDTTATNSRGNQFLNNTFKNAYYYGAYIYYGTYQKFIGNKVLDRWNYSTNQPQNVSSYGLMWYYQNRGPVVSHNYLRGGYIPFYYYYANYYSYDNGSLRAKAINNMVIASASSNTGYTMYPYYAQNIDIWYNTFVHRGTSTAYGPYLYHGYTNMMDVRNNIFACIGASGTHYVMYNTTTTNVFTAFDYNLYWSPTTGPIFYYMGTTYTGWANLPRTTHNIYSKFGNPYFVDVLDPHSRSWAGFQAGTPIASVTDDYDGQARSATTPCIGADEYPTPPWEFDVAASRALLDYADGAWARKEGAATHDVTFTVQNLGLQNNPTTVQATYKLGSAPANATDGVQQTFTSVPWTGNSAVLTFTQDVTGLPAGTNQTVYVRTFYTGDQATANDVSSDTHPVDIVKVYGNESFNDFVVPSFNHDDANRQPMGWTVANGGGTNAWVTAAGTGVGGSIAAQVTDAGGSDDWLFTPATWLISGSSYRIEGMLRSLTGTPQTVQLAFGPSPNAASMTVFATFTNFTNTGFATFKTLNGGVFSPYFNTPPTGDAYYYVGVHVVTGSNTGVAIDNIVVDDNPSPPPKISFGLPGDPLSTYIDNPAYIIKVGAVYKQPGTITKTYEVQNKLNIYGVNGDFLWDVTTATPWITLVKDVPNPTAQGWNFVPPRPRQYQNFSLVIDPSGLPPGVHTGTITLYGILFNNDFPPPASGLVATNEPLTMTVQLTVNATGTKNGPAMMTMTYPGTMTPPNVYQFTDPNTGSPIATVKPTSGAITGMTITCYPNQLPTNIIRERYVKRYWQITTTSTGWTMDLALPYTDPEASMVTDKYQLRAIRQPLPMGAWEVPMSGTSSISDPMNNIVEVVNVNASNYSGSIALAQPYMVSSKQSGETPAAFSLDQNYPNPFNPTTTVAFAVPEESRVRIAVYNSLGQEVAELTNRMYEAGRYTANFEATGLPSGVYLCRMTAGSFQQAVYMTLSK